MTNPPQRAAPTTLGPDAAAVRHRTAPRLSLARPQRLPAHRRPARPRPASALSLPSESPMLHYALIFLVVAMVVALFGFGGLAAGAVSLTHLLAMIFIVLAVLALIAGLLRGR